MHKILSLLWLILLIYSPFQINAEAVKQKIIYIHPGQAVNVLAFDNPIFNRDGGLEHVRQLQAAAAKAGYELRQTTTFTDLAPFEFFIFFEVPDHLSQLEQYAKEKLILLLWEPPSVSPHNYIVENHRPFGKIFTWNDDLVDNTKYFKLYYPVMNPLEPNAIPFENKKLCTFIACNKHSNFPNELYSERRKLISFYESTHPEDFDLFGKWWPTTLKTYRGPVNKKLEVLRNYKFAFAYENIKGQPGYVTEKIFDCFQAGCVPVYLGASNVSDYIPKNCFIAREDFKSDQELYAFIKDMSAEKHAAYITNIEKYLASDKAKLFSCEHFVSTIMKLIPS